jgi:hypothetical protein
VTDHQQYWLRIGLLWLIGVLLSGVMVTALLYANMENLKTKQLDYNRSVVACVEAGGEALACKAALQP